MVILAKEWTEETTLELISRRYRASPVISRVETKVNDVEGCCEVNGSFTGVDWRVDGVDFNTRKMDRRRSDEMRCYVPLWVPNVHDASFVCNFLSTKPIPLFLFYRSVL